MKRTLFTLFPHKSADAFNQLLKNLPIATQKAAQLAADDAARNVVYKSMLQIIQEDINSAKNMRSNRQNRDLLKSAEYFKNAATKTDLLLNAYPKHLISNADKLVLAQVYAHYANTVRIYELDKSDLVGELIQKAFELDPNNKLARELYFDRHFFDLVPSPFGNEKN